MQQGSTTIPLWAWGVFAGIVAVLLVVDLVVTTGERAESRRWALLWSVIWVGTGLAFAGAIWWLKDAAATLEYLTVFLLEKSLSLDNLVVFLVIFTSLGIPTRFQHRALFWGIVGAVVFRGIFIFAGAAALERFHWVVYVFAAILLYAAWESFRQDPNAKRRNRLVERLSAWRRVSKGLHEGRFVARDNGRYALTSVGVALIAIELSDIMFAVDSIAAALSITRDRFVVYSANIFAILGLRAIYLLLANLIGDWPYLHYGVAAVLGFTAVKLLVEPIYEIPVWASLLFIVVAISTSIATSVHANRKAAG